MKTLLRTSLITLIALAINSTANAASTFTLNGLFTFGPRGDGSVQPVSNVGFPSGVSDSIGISPYTGFEVRITAQGTTNAWFPNEIVTDQRTGGSTNGFNMRGLTYDPVSGSLVYVDTHSGSGGSITLMPNAGVYILDSTNGTVITTLNTNGIVGGAYTHVGAAVADDGVVYVCNQVPVSTNSSTPFKMYRWNSVSSVDPPVVAFSGTLSPPQRYGESIDIRGAGATTQILIGSMPGSTGTNVVIFTTSDGTNFIANVIGCTNVTSANFNDGIAFKTNNTFWAKRIGAPLLYLSYDLAAGTARTRETRNRTAA